MRAVDLFAGAGGFTEGATQAGLEVLWAANHWPSAVAAHESNHPTTEVVCQDVNLADWAKVPAHDVLLASPCCQGHAKARGADKPHHDTSRQTAWGVVACAEYHEPTAIVVENVAEFLDWNLFPAWRLALETLGYHLTANVIDAADAGVPQHRRRVFVVASRTGAIHVGQPELEHVPVSDVLDFDSGRWSPIRKPKRAAKTIARADAGRARYGRRFVMPYYGSGSGRYGRSIDRPLGTVTTRDRWALVDGDDMRMLTVDEYAGAMGFPKGYTLGRTRRESIHLLGNAVPPPLASHVVGEVLAAI